jgi:lysozyme
MVFNMGWLDPAGTHGLGTFHHTLAAIQAGRWREAHDGLLASAWAHEVGARALRLAIQLLSGVRAPEAAAA